MLPADLPLLTPPDEFFAAVLDLSVSGIVYYQPVHDAAGQVVDLTFGYLNPAAQQLLRLPARPAATYRQQFPEAEATGLWAFHREALLTDGPHRLQRHYQADGFDDHYLLAARRVGEGLLVSFAAASEPVRSVVEQALRESQAREQAARAEAEARRQRLHQVLMKMPAHIALLHGPEHVYDLVNPAYEQLFPARTTLGRSIREVIPELEGQGFYELFDRVYQTGEPYYAPEAEAWADFEGTGQLQRRYYHTSFLPIRDAEGRVTEVLNFAVDVTEQVEARQQVQRLNDELTTARAEAERERNLLQALLAQAPVAIGLFQGEELRITAANAQMAALWGRTPAQVLGRPLTEAVPELRGQGFDDLMRQVLSTHEPVTGTEAPATMLRDGWLQTTYYNFVYQPLYDAAGAVLGVIDVAVEVTEQVQARRQLEQLNQELETRVQERTRQLTEQQQLLSRILRQVPAAIATLSGPEHRFTFANDLYQGLIDHRVQLGKSVAEVMPELVSQGIIDLLDRVYTTGEPFIGQELPVQLRDATGTLQQRYFDFVYQPMLDAQGQTGILVFAVDVTGQVQARQQVEHLNQALEARVQERTQEAQLARAAAERQRGELQRVFEQAPIAIAVYRGPRYVIELANPTVCRLWGRTQDQIVGLGLFEALPEVAGMGYEELLDEVMATGVPHVAHAMEAVHEREGRRDTVYWDFVYVPMYQEDGRIDGAMVVANEVTEQVQARRQLEQLNQELETRVQERTRQLAAALADAEAQREQLRVQQGLLSQILRLVPASIATLNGPEHRYSFFNELYQTLSADRTALGRTVAEVFPEVVEQGFIDLLDRVYATGEPFVGTDVSAALYDPRTRRPEQRYVDFLYQPLFDERQRVTGILAFILDVTDKAQARQQVQALNEELRAANAELNATNAQLTRINADLDTFVYTASHDLKAPIANIEGLLDALRDYLPANNPEPMVPHLLHLMQGAVARFQQTVGHLTDVSRLQHAQPAELVPLAALVDDVRLDLASLIETTRTHLLLDLDDCPTVYFAVKNLRSILYNLLSNALKYRHPDRTPLVQLRAHCQQDQLVLTVQDNGLGLTEPQQSKLFTLFRRLHSHVEGSGVGLYMIKRIVENAGGTIAVQSQPGQGSTFTVTLPHTFPD
ncbi:PAS domain-containing protein [Hymenobacter jeollabukensis]|uniref:histidine kinase n=1 Tax=Hymenobacter jeollabukensis TaxID=2025313 RepID=A0A5R8WRX1_9BACT|nr:PAS domain-containing protein [Hymenobacter jeollabukensis]TLM93131.1 PAS domain S-box protein [Hymenobacter jeollabukensis]